MSTNPANAIDREDLQRSHDESRFGPQPEPGPKCTTPEDRAKAAEFIREWISADSLAAYLKLRWTPDTASRG